jgi:hypothetical protein
MLEVSVFFPSLHSRFESLIINFSGTTAESDARIERSYHSEDVGNTKKEIVLLFGRDTGTRRHGTRRNIGR